MKNKKPKYTQLFPFDEFDRYISSCYHLEKETYIHIVDHLMSESDAEIFFSCTEKEDFVGGQKIIDKYLQK